LFHELSIWGPFIWELSSVILMTQHDDLRFEHKGVTFEVKAIPWHQSSIPTDEPTTLLLLVACFPQAALEARGSCCQEA